MEEELLKKLGLTQYEIDAYLALLNLGPTTAYRLGKKSGVPSGRIYDIAEKLTLKGLAALEPGEPKKYKAVEPEKALKSLLNKKERKWKETKHEIEELIPKLKKKEITEDPISIVKERQIYYQKIKDTYQKTNKEICCIAQGLTGGKRGIKLTKNLKKASSRGIKTKMVVPITKENEEIAENIKEAGAEVRNCPLEGVRLIIRDGKVSHFGISDQNLPYERATISIESPRFTKGLKHWFNVLWKNSKPL